MIVITGAAGFIGSNLLQKLNTKLYKDIVIVDDFTKNEKENNFINKTFIEKIERDSFFDWFKQNRESIQFVFHIGARTDTTEFDENIFNKLNLGYSQRIWDLCSQYNIPLIYASSAATYGIGEQGYNDDHKIIEKLKPLNPYGESKNEFDKWVLKQPQTPPYWAGLKYFNVYGPNEYHKGRMASVIFHAYNQIKSTGKMKLFRSHNPDFKDGKQKRDFIFIKDVVDVMYYLMQHQKESGIYNLGTGKARTFLDLVRNTFKAMGLKENIEFIDTPLDIREKYQYFTEARMEKLRSIGYNQQFYTLETGIEYYVKKYLSSGLYN